jgi:hypothetical protein
MTTNRNLENLFQFMDLAANKLGLTTAKDIEANFEKIVLKAQSMMLSSATKIMNSRSL